jgi:putative hydrolase of the HAD superfamily
MSLGALAHDLALLSLDAGNTIVFFDAEAAADAARRAGFSLSPDALDRAMGTTKHLLERGVDALARPLDDAEIPTTWSAFMLSMVEAAAGLERAASESCVRALWRSHREFNLWRRVPHGLVESVRRVRRAGVTVCVVSNSEGQLEVLFRRLGIADAFDQVIDSHVVGVEKPDPEIFRLALEPFGVEPARALHIGDVYAVDIVGARAAGLRAALIDPSGVYAGLHHDVPRIDDVASLANAIADAVADPH